MATPSSSSPILSTPSGHAPLTPPSPPATTAVTPCSPPPHAPPPPPVAPPIKAEDDCEDELLLKWDDHHKSFFELAEDLCHQEQFIDVTLSCGEHNFPAHKLILSVCSPYFRHLFLRNPCKHPIVVLKDVHFKYMKLLLMYMYRGEVSCPQEDLTGLLKTARSLQIRGLVELERKREAEGLTNSMTGSPLKRGGVLPGEASTTSDLHASSPADFSLDDVRSRLHGQLEIQPISQPSSTYGGTNSWLDNYHHQRPSRTDDVISKAIATSSNEILGRENGNNNGIGMDDDDRMPHQYQKLRKIDEHHRPSSIPPHLQHSSDVLHPPSHLARLQSKYDISGTDLSMHNRRSPYQQQQQQQHMISRPRGRTASRSSSAASAAAAAAAAAVSAAGSAAASQLLAAAQAAGMPSSALDPSDPMSSMNALLAAAQAHGSTNANNNNSSSPSSSSGNHHLLSAPPPVSTLASLLPSTSSNSSGSPPVNSTPPAAAGSSTTSGQASNGRGGANGGANGGEGVDLGQAAAVANLQLYYYMQKVASAGMGNPKERKECPICGKTLYDRSTWNRHMRIHTGEKPYPCQFCGRRFRTNYNKLGHEKKCPDRHTGEIINNRPQQQQQQQPPQSAQQTTTSTNASREGQQDNAVYSR